MIPPVQHTTPANQWERRCLRLTSAELDSVFGVIASKILLRLTQ